MRLAEQLDMQELIVFGTAVQTNMRYGGRLSSILANLSQLFRDAARVQRELKAATGEVRLSGIILSCLPLGTASILAMMNPRYMSYFIANPSGHKLGAIALGLQLIGVMVMRRIMRLDY
jgi:tight adherence protein B